MEMGQEPVRLVANMQKFALCAHYISSILPILIMRVQEIHQEWGAIVGTRSHTVDSTKQAFSVLFSLAFTIISGIPQQGNKAWRHFRTVWAQHPNSTPYEAEYAEYAGTNPQLPTT